MSDKEEIRRILKDDLQDGVHITKRQLDKAVEEVSKLPHVDEDSLRDLGEKIVGDPDTFINASEDLGDINNALGQGKPAQQERNVE